MSKRDKDLVDLHIHTDASDGTWSLKETIAMVHEKNIKYFSITDHDTFENGLKAFNYIPKNIEYILGAEISSTYKGKEYHILAYGFDSNNEALKTLVRENQFIREENNRDLINYVKEYALVNDVSDYTDYQWDFKRGGWKSLNYLIDKGVINDINSYFNLISISELTLTFQSPKNVIETIHQAGGYSFLAHPSAYGKNKMDEELLNDWLTFGIDGLECYSPYFERIEDADYYVNFCKSNGLMISGGSDCHGTFNARSIGSPKVTWDMTTLEALFTYQK